MKSLFWNAPARRNILSLKMNLPGPWEQLEFTVFNLRQTVLVIFCSINLAFVTSWEEKMLCLPVLAVTVYSFPRSANSVPLFFLFLQSNHSCKSLVTSQNILKQFALCMSLHYLITQLPKSIQMTMSRKHVFIMSIHKHNDAYTCIHTFTAVTFHRLQSWCANLKQQVVLASASFL